jgi:hypothetical protein
MDQVGAGHVRVSQCGLRAFKISPREGADNNEILSLTIVLGLLVAGSAVFVAQKLGIATACIKNCDLRTGDDRQNSDGGLAERGASHMIRLGIGFSKPMSFRLATIMALFGGIVFASAAAKSAEKKIAPASPSPPQSQTVESAQALLKAAFDSATRPTGDNSSALIRARESTTLTYTGTAQKFAVLQTIDRSIYHYYSNAVAQEHTITLIQADFSQLENVVIKGANITVNCAQNLKCVSVTAAYSRGRGAMSAYGEFLADPDKAAKAKLAIDFLIEANKSNAEGAAR